MTERQSKFGFVRASELVESEDDQEDGDEPEDER